MRSHIRKPATAEIGEGAIVLFGRVADLLIKVILDC